MVWRKNWTDSKWWLSGLAQWTCQVGVYLGLVLKEFKTIKSLRLTHLTSLPYTLVPCRTHAYTFSPSSSYTSKPPPPPFSGWSKLLSLVRLLFVWEPWFFILSYSKPMGTKVTLPFRSCFLYNWNFWASRLLVPSPAFTLVSCSAYWTLKMEETCLSESSIDFPWTT
jgi:hypothetical protein